MDCGKKNRGFLRNKLGEISEKYFYTRTAYGARNNYQVCVAGKEKGFLRNKLGADRGRKNLRFFEKQIWCGLWQKMIFFVEKQT